MTLVELVQMIGAILTGIDGLLSQSDFWPTDPNWNQLYALRNQLNDQQRRLMKLSINLADASYKDLTDQITAANSQMNVVIGDLTKVESSISLLKKVASYVDEVLQKAEKAAA